MAVREGIRPGKRGRQRPRYTKEKGEGSTHHCVDATNSVKEAHCYFIPTEVKM